MNLTKDFLLWVLLFILVNLYFIDNDPYSRNFLIIDGNIIFPNFNGNIINNHELDKQINLNDNSYRNNLSCILITDYDLSLSFNEKGRILGGKWFS